MKECCAEFFGIMVMLMFIVGGSAQVSLLHVFFFIYLEYSYVWTGERENL